VSVQFFDFSFRRVRLKSLRATTQRKENIMGQDEMDIADLVGAYPTCGTCGSRDVVRDAWAVWNFATSEWALKTTFDHFACDKCGGETTPAWKLDEEFRKKRIQRLNDDARCGLFKHGMVVITSGVQAFEDKLRAAIVDQISLFDDFTEDNDPHKEHDFGSVTVAGHKIFWKVDYFDLGLKMLSPDPANQNVTNRVLTIMLASEY